MDNVAGAVELELSVFGGENLEISPTDCPQGLSPDAPDMAFIPGSVFTRPSLKRFLTVPGNAQIVYSTSFVKNDGTLVQMVFDSLGNIYANGTRIGTTAAGNRFKTCNAFGRTYIATSDGLHGTDVPLHYDGTHLDRISQDGPGGAPNFAASSIVGNQYSIVSITQPAPGFPGQLGFFDGIMQSAGPGSGTPGNVITVYTANARAGHFPGGDPALTNAFNSGQPTYVYLSNLPAEFSSFNGTQLVTSVGLGVPNFNGADAERWYFTFQVSSSAFRTLGGFNAAITGQYQLTAATMTTAVSVPELSAGDSPDISGASVAAYDGSWQIRETVNSGVLDITHTELSGGVATYSYTVLSGAAPVVGQSVAVTGTLNANGALNRDDLVIATATGGSTGSFTVNGFDPSQTFPSTVENGTGVTAGSVFIFDPGTKTIGTPASPIYGNSTGGTLTFGGTTAVISPGTRQGVVIFQTRSGYLTIPSKAVTFTIPANTNAIAVTNIPIGPPNVVARILAFTGANGVKFFYLPVAPKVSGVVSGTSTVINDNTTTSVTLNFTDQALLAALAIDIPGNNLFRQVVLGPCLGIFPYAGRIFAWGERNKVQQFWNMGFEGGYYASSPNIPLGWSVIGSGSVVNRGDYGQAFQASSCTLSQGAFQDQYGIAILTPETQYTFRAWAQGEGTITAKLFSPSVGLLATAMITAQPSGGFVEQTFSAKTPQVIPSDTEFQVVISGSSILLDELEVYYTDNPYLKAARASYINNPEAFDGVTGLIGPATDPNEVRALFQRKDILCMLTAGPNGSLYEAENTPSGEPATWNIQTVASKCGAVSVWGDAQFEDWQVWASDTGLRIYDGGAVEKMSQEVQPWWDSFNLSAKQFVVVGNDTIERRIHILAPTGTATVPNSAYMLDYRELNTAAVLANSGTLRTGFGGKSFTTDLTRKWSPWSIKANYCSMMNSGGGSRMTFCGGSGTNISDSGYSSVYSLAEGVQDGLDDDYGPFSGYYTTYYFVSPDEAAQLQLGKHRKIYINITLYVAGTGFVVITPLVDRDGFEYPDSPAIPLRLNPNYDTEIPLNVDGERVAFRISANPGADGKSGLNINSVVVAMKDHPYSIVRGSIY